MRRLSSAPTALAALAGFLLPWGTVWILRPGILGSLSRGASAAWGVPWPLATIGVYASDVVLLIAAAVGIMRRWRTDRRRLLLTIALLAVVAAVNVIASADPWLSMAGWIRLIALLLALAGLPYSERATRAFLGGFLVAMLGHAVLGIVEFFSWYPIASTLLGIAPHDAATLGDAVIMRGGERWLRAYGGFPHPNVFGVALLVALLVISTGASRASEVEKSPIDRPEISRLRSAPLEMTMLVLLIVALLLTFSRSALLGLVILFAVWALRPATRRLAAVGAIVLAVAVVATWSFWVPRVTTSNRNETRALDERRTALADARTLIAAHPIVGVGLHAMPQAIVTFDRARDPYTAQPVHNVLLLALVEVGILGILILCIALRQFTRFVFGIWNLEFGILLLPLLPSLLLDHALWSLPVGLALLFVFFMTSAGEKPALS